MRRKDLSTIGTNWGCQRANGGKVARGDVICRQIYHQDVGNLICCLGLRDKLCVMFELDELFVEGDMFCEKFIDRDDTLPMRIFTSATIQTPDQVWLA